LILHVSEFDLVLEFLKIALLLHLDSPGLLYLELSLIIVAAELGFFETAFQRITGGLTGGLTAGLVLIYEIVVNSVVEVCIVILLVLAVEIFALRSELNHSLGQNEGFDFRRPLITLFLFFIEVAHSGVERGQNYRLS